MKISRKNQEEKKINFLSRLAAIERTVVVVEKEARAAAALSVNPVCLFKSGPCYGKFSHRLHFNRPL
jgi:hypothetical protein